MIYVCGGGAQLSRSMLTFKKDSVPWNYAHIFQSFEFETY
jgi:hypothetical protein